MVSTVFFPAKSLSVYPVKPRFRGEENKGAVTSPALEWIETSNDGSYASSTVGGANTRRYHGLLVGSYCPPVNRRVLLSRIDDQIQGLQGQDMVLSKSLFEGQDPQTLHEPLPLLKRFTPLPIPTWIFALPEGKGVLKKQLAMRRDQATVVIGYALSADAKEPIRLSLKPLFNERDYHALSHGTWEWTQEQKSQGIVVKSGGVNPIFLQWRSSQPDRAQFEYTPEGSWHQNYFYQREADRGLDRTDNNYTPGELSVTLHPGETISLTASIQPLEPGGLEIDAIANEKAQKLEQLLDQAKLPDTEVNRLLLRAADQFIVHRRSVNGPTVIAGYHWFNDWGRDTMIALPGLTLSTGRFKDAEGILTTFAKYAKNGMLPNNFPDAPDADPGYNTLDASMWWFHAVDAYRKAIQVVPQSRLEQQATYLFLKAQYQALQQVITHHIYGRHSGDELLQANPAFRAVVDPGHPQLPVGQGTDGIGMETDGLIAANNPQLTWMDAAADGQAFTPRAGKPIEINALWYNGLKVMADLARILKNNQTRLNPQRLGESNLQQAEAQYDRDIARYEALANAVKQNLQKFWNPEQQCLKDLIDAPENWREAQIRPNQIFAVSLPHRAFSPEQEQAVLKTVEDHLLTPYGLRSLSPQDLAYAPFYPNAGPRERDQVYHQGPVWSWLIGPYLDAYLNVNGNDVHTRKKALRILQPLLEHLQGKVAPHVDSGSALGGVAEIFDGNAPHYAKGTVNQAWSVSELLRQLVSLTGSEQGNQGGF